MDFSEQKDFEINTASLREIRNFSRNIFDRSKDLSSKKDDLVPVSYTHLTLPTKA